MILDQDHPLFLSDGRYRVKRVLGVGGMAVVLLAHDNKMGVDRAIKLLHKRMARSEHLRTRFENEARAQAGLSHPNILMVHDVVEEEAGFYLVMELAEAGSLATLVQSKGARSPREVARFGAVLAGAMEVAHDQGVIHRDIKPDNILIDRLGNLKIADFGIARLTDDEAQLTGTGMVMGTWMYMPPEQRESSREVDGRADIYALGVTLYYLLSGRLPPALHNAEAHERYFEGFPDALVAVIAKATRFNPDDRYPNCAALEDALLGIHDSLSEEPVPGARTALLGAPREPGLGEVLDLDHIQRDHPEAYQTLLPLVDAWSKTLGPDAPVVKRRPDPTVIVDDEVSEPEPEPQPDPEPAPEAPARVPVLLFALLGMALLIVPAIIFLPSLLDPELPPAPAAEAPTAAPVAESSPAPAEQETPPSPGIEPVEAAPPSAAAPASASEPAAAATAGQEDRSSSGSERRSPRVITVVPTAAEPAATEPATEVLERSEAPSGLLVVRTVPSGAEAWSAGSRLVKEGRGYPMTVGRHLVELRSPGGESTLIPLTIRADDVVEVCYSFDTNSACGGGTPR